MTSYLLYNIQEILKTSLMKRKPHRRCSQFLNVLYRSIKIFKQTEKCILNPTLKNKRMNFKIASASFYQKKKYLFRKVFI